MKRGIRYFLLAFLLPVSLFADGYGGVVSSEPSPEAVTQGVTQGLTFDQNLGKQVPLDAVFRDESGATVRLEDYLGKRPVILALAYYKCPNLCTVVIREAFQALQAVQFHRDDAYALLVLSFDPQETPAVAAPKLRAHLKSYPRVESIGYTHFLTGNEDQIRRVADAIGFHYRWDDRSHQFIHPSGLTVLTPEGKISKYLYGIRYEPRDLRLALVEASHGKIGTAVDKLMLFCYQYDPTSGKYGFVIMRALRVFGGLTVTALGGFIFGAISLERRKRRRKTNKNQATKGSDSVR